MIHRFGSLQMLLRDILDKLGLPSSKVEMSPDEGEFLRAIFVPEHYARETGLMNKRPDALFAHYLRHGLRLNIAGTPLFDSELFARNFSPVVGLRVPDILRWYREQRHTDFTPTKFFDADFYQKSYPDIPGAELSPYEHFIRFGVREERRPNRLFDPHWYNAIAERRQGEEGMPPFIHFLVYGIERGASPCAGLLPVLQRTPTARADAGGTFDRIRSAIAPWEGRLRSEQMKLLLLLFNPDIYDGGGELPATASGLARLEHFLSKGIHAGLEPGPLFDRDHYLSTARIDSIEIGNALLHFLEHGVRQRIVPTRLFDDEVYAAAWPDIGNSKGTWGFQHFIEHGIFEGRRIDGSDRISSWSLPPDTPEGRMHNWELFWRESGYQPRPPVPAKSPAVAPSGHTKSVIGDRDLLIVKAMFVPRFYAQQAGLELEQPSEVLFEHFLREGLDRDLAPGPFFDPQIARKLTGAKPGDALRSWLRKREVNGPAPTSYFDLRFYRSRYPEFQGVSFDLFEHFLLHGLKENRAPTFAFDASWYSQAYDHPACERDIPAYIHYLLFGAARGLAPSRLLLTTFNHVPEGELPGLEAYLHICRAGSPWIERLGSNQLQVILAMFSPYTYDGAGKLSKQTSGPRRLVHFLERGLEEGLSPSPLFDPVIYRSMGSGSAHSSILDYVRSGWQRRQIPTRLFSEEDYQAVHTDIKAHKIWGFQHFLFHGLYEGRKVDALPRLTLFPKADDVAARELNNARLFWVACGVPSENVGLPSALGRTQQRLNQVVASPLLKEIVERAVAIDPVVGDFRKGDAYHAPPFHDRAYPAILKLLERIPAGTYGTIICVPWLRTGGADLVACQLAEAAKLACPDERVLILRLDAQNFERREWVPVGVEVALLADILDDLAPSVAERLIFTLLKILEPRRIVNVNSLRMWRTVERFGRRLEPHVKLYSYLFCWDQTPEGLRVGYPSMFFASTAPQLTGVFVDTSYLRNELESMYRPPENIMKRLRVLYTPSRTQPPARTFAEMRKNKRGKRPKVLWAGRLDRQKRFDLVQAIAARMPHVDFLCWGSPVLDSPPDLSTLPTNLKLFADFTSYDQLPLSDADVWLFTSRYEGMPTILIEIAVRGLVVVASAVGGVPELVDDKTGFPVHEVDDVDAYVHALEHSLKSPELAVARAKRLQERALSRHSQHRYISDLKVVFEQEA